jgi:hypothetical protein
MSRMNRHVLARSAYVVALFAVLLAIGWAVTDFASGILSAIAIGTGVAVAVFAGNRRGCSPRVLRRRER